MTMFKSIYHSLVLCGIYNYIRTIINTTSEIAYRRFQKQILCKTSEKKTYCTSLDIYRIS